MTTQSRRQCREGFLYFLGDEGSGKSAAIHTFLNPNKKINDDSKRQGLSYSFAKKLKDRETNVKDIVHIWEFSGPRAFTTELTNVDTIFLASKQVTTATVVIVLDLSKPGDCFDSALYWLSLVKTKLQTVYAKLRERGSKLPDQLKSRAKKAYFAQHKDKDLLNHTGIQLLLLGTKYEHMQLQDTEKRQILYRGLRFLAHVHGAHLLFIDGLKQSADVKGSSNNRKGNIDAGRSLLNHLAFSGFDKRMTSFKLPIQQDHHQPLLILAGNNDLESIGLPTEGHSFSTIDSALASWKYVILNTFPSCKTKSSLSDILKTHDFIDQDFEEMLNSMTNEDCILQTT